MPFCVFFYFYLYVIMTLLVTPLSFKKFNTFEFNHSVLVGWFSLEILEIVIPTFRDLLQSRLKHFKEKCI